MRTRLISGEKGFTLLELLISMVLFVILAMVVFNIFDASMVYLKRGQILADRNQKARAAMDLMERELFNAYTINAPGVGASSNTLTFRARVGIQADIEGYRDYTTIETVTYRLTSAKLERAMLKQNQSVTPVAPPLTTGFETVISDVSQLTFTRSTAAASNAVRVDLRVNTPNPGNIFMPYTSLLISRNIFVRNLP